MPDDVGLLRPLADPAQRQLKTILRNLRYLVTHINPGTSFIRELYCFYIVIVPGIVFRPAIARYN